MRVLDGVKRDVIISWYGAWRGEHDEGGPVCNIGKDVCVQMNYASARSNSGGGERKVDYVNA